VEIIAFLQPLSLYFLGGNYGTSWNMREIGGILAVAVMGTFILWSIRHKEEKQYKIC
jgi:hypothetical protein